MNLEALHWGVIEIDGGSSLSAMVAWDGCCLVVAYAGAVAGVSVGGIAHLLPVCCV